MTEPMDLGTQRLFLRRLRAGDAVAICAYRRLPVVARFQSWESFELADAEQLVAGQLGVVPDTPGRWLQLALILRESDTLVGDCGIHFRDDDPRQVEVGITLSPNYHGRGLAFEAVHGVLEYVFDRLGKHRVTAVTDAQNTAAANLFRRLGFRQEAHCIENIWFKGSWGSEFSFALLRREWHARRTGE